MATAALDKKYEKVHKLIMWTVHKFIDSHGGDFDELMGESNLYFMRAVERHDPERGSFGTYVRYTIYKNLLEKHRNDARHNRIAPTMSIYEMEGGNEETTTEIPLPAPASKFRLFEFMDELSEDAKLITKLVVDTPTGLTNIMVRNGGRPHNRRAVIRDYLTGLGWHPKRITESFSEITAVLNSY